MYIPYIIVGVFNITFVETAWMDNKHKQKIKNRFEDKSLQRWQQTL